MKTTPVINDGLQSLALSNLAFTVKDIDATIKWYGDVFGFEVLKRASFDAIGAKVAFLNFADINLEILEISGQIRIPEMFANPPDHLLPVGNKTLVLKVKDLALATKELEEKGVEFAWKTLNLTEDGSPNTMIRDLDGNFISIFEADELSAN
jgi:catechol 2,3-dioxygenase-like lactoylglutathione lyase family enzyme